MNKQIETEIAELIKEVRQALHTYLAWRLKAPALKTKEEWAKCDTDELLTRSQWEEYKKSLN